MNSTQYTFRAVTLCPVHQSGTVRLNALSFCCALGSVLQISILNQSPTLAIFKLRKAQAISAIAGSVVTRVACIDAGKDFAAEPSVPLELTVRAAGKKSRFEENCVSIFSRLTYGVEFDEDDWDCVWSCAPCRN